MQAILSVERVEKILSTVDDTTFGESLGIDVHSNGKSI